MVFLAVNTKAVLGVALVALTAIGGCRAKLANGDEIKAGSITGTVIVEDVNLAPVSPAGWRVTVSGQTAQGVVTADGAYAIADVPPGVHAVNLLAPALEGAVPVCSVPGCSYANVTVMEDAATMYVDFNVSYVPSPPFQ